MLKGCMGILWIYEKSCHIALSLPGSRLVIGKPELWQVVVYYVCLCAAAILWGRKRNLVSVLCFLSGIILISYRFVDAGKLNITMLDVGQGDGIFIKGPKGGAYLIDGGSSDVKGVGKYRIEPFLKSQGAGTLDYVFISHGDGDHVNGVEEMLERQEAGIRIRNLILPAEPVWDETLERLAAKAGENGTKVFIIEPGQEVAEGKLEIRCLFPSPHYKGEKGNGASMVLSVSYEGFDMLLTGDVEGEGEEELADMLEKEYAGTKWEVLKTAHHGSQNSTSERFLEVMKPEYAMISAGKGNRYGHPHEETIQRLSEAGSRIYSTQDNGAVMIEAAGEEIRME